MEKTVFIPILTRNHNNYLKHYLRCIDELDYPKNKIVIYINTNNNDDDSVRTLLDWTQRVHKDYKKIIFEHGDYSGLSKDMGWKDQNGLRLHIMSIIRQRSLDLCKAEKCDYFFPIDTDNWVEPCTLKYLVGKGLPLVAPFMKDYAERNLYSNYFYTINSWGFIGEDSDYQSFKIWHRRNMCGSFEVPLVHCTYLLDCKNINDVFYYDGSNEWEFITFAKSARKNNVKQYICNERMFGFVRYETIVNDDDCYEKLETLCKSNNDKVTDKDILFVGFASKNNPDSKYADRKNACEKTWIKEIDKSKYFIVYTINDPSHPMVQGKPYYYDRDEKTLYINAEDSWNACYYRTRHALSWAINETTSQHIWKVDDDTYVNPSAFNNYTLHKEKDYLGIQHFYENHLILPNSPGSFMHGAGYCLSRRIVPKILENMHVPISPECSSHEDYDVGFIIAKHIPDAVVYSENRIYPSMQFTSQETLDGNKKIDDLLIGHPATPTQMTNMHNYYKREDT